MFIPHSLPPSLHPALPTFDSPSLPLSLSLPGPFSLSPSLTLPLHISLSLSLSPSLPLLLSFPLPLPLPLLLPSPPSQDCRLLATVTAFARLPVRCRVRGTRMGGWESACVRPFSDAPKTGRAHGPTASLGPACSCRLRMECSGKEPLNPSRGMLGWVFPYSLCAAQSSLFI